MRPERTEPPFRPASFAALCGKGSERMDRIRRQERAGNGNGRFAGRVSKRGERDRPQKNKAPPVPDSLPRTASEQRLHESSPVHDGPVQETRTRWVLLFLQYRHSISGKKAHRLMFSEPARNDVPPFRLQPCPAVSCPCGKQQSPSATAIRCGRAFGRS